MPNASPADQPRRLSAHLVQSLWAGAAIALVVALCTLFIPNQYKSEARLLPAESRVGGGLGAASMAAAAVGVSIPGQEGPDAAYLDILNSRSLREALLLTRFNYKARSWTLGAEQVREQSLFDYIGKPNMDRAMKALKDRITTSRDFKSKLITIVVETKNPELSQQVAQRITRLLDEFVVLKSQTRGSTKAAFSEKRLQEARQEMAQAEESFRHFLDGNRNFLLSPDPSVKLKGLRLENELKLRTQIVTTLAISREQALLEEKNDMPILNVLDPGNLPIEKSWPPRAMLIGAAFLLATVLGWLYLNRVVFMSFSNLKK